jgi:hypothetical protein
MALQHATPVTIDRLDDAAVIRRLVRLRRSAKPGDGPRIDERMLQRLIHLSPSILPVGEIEPMFADLRSICEELPLRGGNGGKYIDNLLVNPEGKVCLVECKLWRNSEAVREVIAQVLDYAGELALLSYDELVAAVIIQYKPHDNAGERRREAVYFAECIFCRQRQWRGPRHSKRRLPPGTINLAQIKPSAAVPLFAQPSDPDCGISAGNILIVFVPLKAGKAG